jgi:hypothetical protein
MVRPDEFQQGAIRDLGSASNAAGGELTRGKQIIQRPERDAKGRCGLLAGEEEWFAMGA